MRVDFIVRGEAVGKERPRVFGRHAVTPEKTKVYEAQVGWEYARAAKKAGAVDFLKPPLAVSITAFHVPPKSWSKVKRFAHFGAPWEGVPDADNICKAILDGLQGVAFQNDSSVTYAEISKRYVQSDGEEAHVRVSIWEVTE